MHDAGLECKLLTSSEAIVCRQLQSVLRAVPSLPRELVFALLYSSQCANLHTVSIGQKSLDEGEKYILKCFKILLFPTK